MKRTHVLLRACLALASMMSAATAFAATYEVNSLPDLQARINSAVAGDVIIVHNGVYTTTASITVNRRGTATDPIRILAQTVGGVEIAGSQGFNVTSPATYVEIEGFLFTHISGRNQIRSGATHIRFTRNFFECVGDGAYLTVAGHDAQVDRNEFRNKSTLGNMIDVRGSGSQIAQRVWIHHNYFHDFISPGGNGAETIRFGLSGLSLSNGFGLIEYNLFQRCSGENELISNKSSSNTYRYNTISDSPDGEVADGAPLTSHDRPDNCAIAFNTLVDNTRNYFMTGRTNGLGATNTVFANNIIQGGAAAAGLNGLYTGGVWGGNIIWETAGAGAMPAGSYDVVNPLLESKAKGVFRPRPGSPAIDSAGGDYPAVLFDQDGQPRKGLKDKGADEYSTDPAIAEFLTPGAILRLIHGRDQE